jgi:class 3 adenylate cyclase
MPATTTAKLVVRLADGTVHEHELGEADQQVGRDPTCEIHIPSPYVSRHHARVRRVEGGYVIEDQRSTNGLQINGHTVTEPHRLVSGDRVAIGDVVITYEDGEESVATAVYAGEAPAPLRTGTEPARISRRAGLCTLLFTDLVDHTSVVTRLGDVAGQRWLRRHTALLREQFAAAEGTEEKWTGDGFVVSFASARRALACAIAIQRELDAYNRSAPDSPIHVRAGLHTGEVLREGDELFGNAVILAARVMAEAGPDQILISELMERLILPSGEFRTIDRGLFTLKGFAEPQRLFEVEWREPAA